MAIENITRFNSAKELFRLFTGIYADVWRQVMLYEYWKGTELLKAIEHLKSAIAKPEKVQARILEWVSIYGVAEFDACIALITDGVTRAELNSEINTMVTYCQGLHDDIVAETMTWDEASTDLQSHIENVIPKIVFDFPDGYTDIWGR